MEKQTVKLTLPYGIARDVTFTIAPGECLLLAGPNGSGKTTLLKAISEAGADTPSQNLRGYAPPSLPLPPASPHSRELVVNGPLPLMCRGRRQFWASVSAPAVLIPTNIPKVKGFTVEEFIRTGCYKESNWAGRLNAKTKERMQNALELLGLKQLKDRDISTLSDGEFQKACIAVGLTRNAQLLLLDEPTTFLDVDGRAMVLGTLRSAAEKTGTSVIFTSHDLHASLQYCHRVLAFTRDGLKESTPENRTEVLQMAFPESNSLFL